MIRSTLGASTRFRPVLIVALALFACAAFSVGCASTVEEREFYDEGETTTLLRTRLAGGEPIERGFQHPAEISKERLRRILSTIRVRFDKPFLDPEEKPAIARAILPDVSRALSESLAAANPNEEIALSALRKSRRFGVFTEETLTTFVAYVKDDLLTISLSRVDWNLSNLRASSANKPQLPKPRLGEKQMDFAIVPSPDYRPAGQQAVAGPDAAESLTIAEPAVQYRSISLWVARQQESRGSGRAEAA